MKSTPARAVRGTRFKFRLWAVGSRQITSLQENEIWMSLKYFSITQTLWFVPSKTV